MVFKAMLSRSVRLQEARLWSRVSDLEARTANYETAESRLSITPCSRDSKRGH